jgi:pyruvate dehydrogenase E2 component (dihydrolipoamide acetyltransferase)
MATKVVMAQLSPTMEEGRVVEWKVSEGDEVQQGDVVAEIETDKANMDVEAMGSGVLRRIVHGEGDTVPVGALIGVIGEPDEDISELLEEAGEGAEPEAEPAAAETEAAGEPTAAEAPDEAAPEEAAPAGSEVITLTGRQEAGEEQEAVAAGRDDGRVRASPVARKMAREEGVDLARVEGSGPSGRVIKRDVEAALERGLAAREPAAAPAAGPSRLVDETVEPSQMRKAIARRLSQSLGPVPHFFLTSEIDMERALDLRAELNERRGVGTGEGPPKIGVNDLLLKTVAEALVRHPEINASWTEDGLRRHGSVDLGIAVALDDGLITPVLRGAEAKGLERIAVEAAELIRRARERDLQPEEYRGATFSVSNLGMYPIDQFTAVINPPEAGILAVGRTEEKPVAVDGELTVRRRMRVTMSCDHRVVDGAMGAEFLATFKEMLENPLAMVL